MPYHLRFVSIGTKIYCLEKYILCFLFLFGLRKKQKKDVLKMLWRRHTRVSRVPASQRHIRWPARLLRSGFTTTTPLIDRPPSVVRRHLPTDTATLPTIFPITAYADVRMQFVTVNCFWSVVVSKYLTNLFEIKFRKDYCDKSTEEILITGDITKIGNFLKYFVAET